FARPSGVSLHPRADARGITLRNKPIVVLVLKSPSAIRKVKEMVGSTVPSESDMSTIRGMYSS
ncbi:hypothetical protein COX64_01820, partial [Candidatus Dojkabacteria bacterium CG_4_10_14_0_2_um_filter_Dojkabacteria_WS6_41_15]